MKLLNILKRKNKAETTINDSLLSDDIHGRRIKGNCSGIKNDHWCHDLPIHYSDSRGNDYCVFHTPRGFKGDLLPEAFNEFVLKRIKSDLADKGKCKLSDAVFDWDIDFSSLADETVLHNTDFSGARFHGDADFKRAVFNEKSRFTEVVFYEVAIFDKAMFNGHCCFRKTVFSGKPFIFDTIFEDGVDFSESFFQRGVLFTWGGFKKGGNFDGTQYGENPVFKRPMAA